jgi:hypothetical protein
MVGRSVHDDVWLMRIERRYNGGMVCYVKLIASEGSELMVAQRCDQIGGKLSTATRDENPHSIANP